MCTTSTMAEDLAIDIGLSRNSHEFTSFIGCVQNILEYGCGYDDEFTEDTLTKCRQSELEIAKRVVAELEKPRSKYGRHQRHSKLKWWQKYVQKERQKNTPPMSPTSERHSQMRKRKERQRHRPSVGTKRQRQYTAERERQRRCTSEKDQRRSRTAADCMFAQPRRSMSPMFAQARRPTSPPLPPERWSERPRRPMSPMFERANSDVPEWPSRNKKRRVR